MDKDIQDTIDKTKHNAKRCNLFAFLLGKTVMAISGWKITGSLPESKKMIIIAAPHTSNWDFVHLLGAAYSFRLAINWLGKKSLFPPILGSFMKFLGGFPIDRSKASNTVQAISNIIRESTHFTMIIPPSGTRSKTEYWKSGFYQITLATQIPIVCGYLDYQEKVACLGLTFVPTGNITSDMDRIREFYRGINGKHQEKTSRIRLKEEDSKEEDANLE